MILRQNHLKYRFRRFAMYCKQCGKRTKTQENLCDSCQKQVKEKADRIKTLLDETNILNDVHSDGKEKKSSLGCLAALGILFPPIWLGLLFYHYRTPLRSLFSIFENRADHSSNTPNNSTPESSAMTEEPPVVPNFGFYGGDGNFYRAGGVFCDWAGNLVKWGEPFKDSRGNLVQWGGAFYDSHDNLVQWGEAFYDCKGNLISPR